MIESQGIKTPLQGIVAANRQLYQAATNIAQMAHQDAGVDASLEGEMVNILTAKHQAAANIASLKAESEMQKKLLDIIS